MGNVAPRGLYGKNAGTWSAPADVQARHAGAWTPAQTVWAHDGTGWQQVWVRNVAPGPVTGLAITYTADGGTGWNAAAAWTLPADLDLASVKVRWTINGTTGAWSTLAAGATSTTTPATSGTTVSVEVQVFDTGGLSSSIATAAGGTSPLNAPAVTVTQVGLDTLRATWVHPSGTGRSGYTVTVSGGASGTFADAAGTTSRDVVVTPGVATTVTVTALDNTTGTSRAGRTGSSSPTTAAAPAPGTPTVGAWSYTSITLNWSAATWADGGYEVHRAIGAGAFALVATVPAGTTTYTGAVTADTNYKFKVRAKGTSNTGTFSGEVRPAIGHAAYSETVAYSLAKTTCNIYLNHPDGPQPPAGQGIALNQMVVDLACTFTTSLASGTASRSLYYVANGDVGFPTGSKPNPWQETFSFGAASVDGDVQGIAATGTGWSSTSTGGFRLTGTITVKGTKTTNFPAVANTYW